MTSLADTLRLQLLSGPLTARQLIENMAISQPTLSRELAKLGDEVVRIGAARSIQYALRDSVRGLPDIAVYRVDEAGCLHPQGTLLPVRPAGFVLRLENGQTRHSDGLPWWLADMRPQGYLGRAYAARHSAALGLPTRLSDWNDSHALRALLAHGHDAVGNWLLGEEARAQFLSAAAPQPVAEDALAEHYARLAQAAAQGESPGSSAGGEQPKFTCYRQSEDGPRAVLVKFSEAENSPVSERWRDLLLAEHLALATLRDAGVAAAESRVLDYAGQRFLEVARFDRVGALGRRALFSLAALNAEFVGLGTGGWPVLTQRLAAQRHIAPPAAQAAALLWAFDSLIGNSDMHHGNLSFLGDAPYQLAPAYDMSPMAFAPRSGGGLPDTLPAINLHPAIPHATWRQAASLARDWLQRLQHGPSPRFTPCLQALAAHQAQAQSQIERLG